MRQVFILIFYEGYFLCLFCKSCPHLWRTGWRSRSRCAGSARPSRYCCTPACSSGPPASPSHPGCCSSAGTLKCYTSCHQKPPFQTRKQATMGPKKKPMDARLLRGLDVELRLWNWPVLMQLLMNFPIRRALLPSFNQITHARTREREEPPLAPTMCGEVHAPSCDTANKSCPKGVNRDSL